MLAVKSMRIAINKWQTPRPGAGMPVSAYAVAYAFTRIGLRDKRRRA